VGAQPDEWALAVTWHEGKAYGVSYDVATRSRAARRYGTRLHRSDDGLGFRPLVRSCTRGGADEGTLRFAPDGTCYLLLRRDGQAQQYRAACGTSKPPTPGGAGRTWACITAGRTSSSCPTAGWIAAAV